MFRFVVLIHKTPGNPYGWEALKIKTHKQKLTELRKEVKAFLKETDFVAWSSVVLNPEDVRDLWQKLKKLTNFKSLRD